ncbi:hypothetical protein [Bacillus sp. SJS]|uniref:hypothetical protein n=1 Tax=Bacillus sp. SJS TaxID=1423321 RepID=UPI000690DC7A|nr:hypothetical protein [Bacillus sp. SJS]KZZ83012.1 hypothetical protein AS29_019670 [Bacillus sp. SJS]
MFADKMNKFDRMFLAVMIGPVLFLSSCTFPGLMSQTSGTSIQTKDKVIVFFSDGDKIEDEKQYYDALLAIKEKYPVDSKNFKVYQEEQNNPFGVRKYPSLLVMDNKKVVIHIEGMVQTKEEILKPLRKVLKH